MSTLSRRVQVLFSEDEYDQLSALASQEHRSVGSVVRESVQRVLTPSAAVRQLALTRLLARADEDEAQPVGDWDRVKDSFERDSLRVIG